MMTNLFSIFDPSTSMGFSLNWLSTALYIIAIPSVMFILSSRVGLMWKKMIFALTNEIKILLPNKMKHTMVLFTSLFLFIMLNNVMGLLPYIFTSSSHLVFTLSLALSTWVGYNGYGWLYKYKDMMAHLVPNSTPTLLIPFMVLIETVSNLIRPLTLSVRLAANMIAGHLLMTLLSSYISVFMTTYAATIIVSQILLIMLETAVAFIQAYVFTVLSVLYISEI